MKGVQSKWKEWQKGSGRFVKGTEVVCQKTAWITEVWAASWTFFFGMADVGNLMEEYKIMRDR